ncbi:MAG: glycosyltransferase [Rikenellaceae bacterium]
MKTLAPIVLFAFNRLEPLKHTIASLLSNKEAQNSSLYVFVDGAREHKHGEKEKVQAVQDFVKTIDGFGCVEYEFSQTNKGLASSIIDGVGKVLRKHTKVIVLEDDLVFSYNFLSYMNGALDYYEDKPKLFSICGYTNKVTPPRNYGYSSYFCTRSSSWGWATWSDRWNSVDWKLEDWDECVKYRRQFNKWGGSDCFGMLEAVKQGKTSSWAIRFCYAQFLQDKLSLFPIKSLVKNDGFDGDGTNCKKWSRFKCEFDPNNSVECDFPDELKLNKRLCKSALSYHTIFKRVVSKLMYMIT